MTDHHRDDRRTELDEYGLELRDDAIIGKAFVWSMVVFVGIAVLGGGVWLALSLQEEPGEVIIAKEIEAPEALVPDVAVLPDVGFTNIADEAGLTQTHVSGAMGEKLLPETMGGGAAFLDIDGDGDQDLVLASGAWWSHGDRAGDDAATSVWINDSTGRFSRGPDVAPGVYATGLACGDYDADGRVDLFIAALGEDLLYRNTADGFVNVTASAGVGGGAIWSTSPAFVDIDGDDDLDLFVPHYIQWSRDKDIGLNFTLNGTDRAYGPPKQYAGTQPVMWRNNGDGTFTDITGSAGMVVVNPSTGVPVGKSLAVAPADLNRDGHMDLLVANDTTRNFLYTGNGDGTFTERGVEAGVAYDERGMATGAMGIDVGHYRNDEPLGIGIGNFANEMTSFYVGDPLGRWFTDEAVVEGIGSSTRPQLSFGLFFFDYDLDGRLDLFQTNGHLEEEINEVQASQHYRQPAQLFWNTGAETSRAFEIVPPETAKDLVTPIVGRGAAYADIDADGDLDVIVTQPGDVPLLLRNDQALGHHWLRVRLADDTSANRDAIGAWVTLTSGGVTQRRQVMPTRSYLSQVELPVTFGLGTIDRIDALEVTWPDGTVQDVDVSGLTPDQSITITRS